LDFTLFSKSSEIFNKFTKKGDRVMLDGRLKLDSWVDRDNNKKSKISLVVESFTFLGCKNNNNQAQQPQAQAQQSQAQQQHQQQKANGYMPDADDDIPFSIALLPIAGALSYFISMAGSVL